MGEEDEADGGVVPRRVAAGLVEGLDAPDAEAEPRRDGRAGELEVPEPEPSLREGARREHPVEPLVAQEGGPVVPAPPVELDEAREVAVELGRGRREPEARLVLAEERALAAPQLLAEVRAAHGEELVPRRLPEVDE